VDDPPAPDGDDEPDVADDDDESADEDRVESAAQPESEADGGQPPSVEASCEAGGVLGRDLIEELCRRQEAPLIENFEPSCLKPAAYDLRVATDGLVTPDGDYFEPGRGRHHAEALIIEPGATAFFSTHERLNMPPNLVANMFVKGSLARRGIVLLTGSIVDPGWKPDTAPPREGDPPSGRDGRLHFTVANLGLEPVAIFPKSTPVVSIQFMRVIGGSGVVGPTDTDRIWDQRPKGGLGFVERLARLDTTVKEVKRTVDRQERATEIVTVAAFFVLATTILGVSLASVLTAASDQRLTDAVRQAIPDKASDRVFVLTVIVAAAWVVFSVALFGAAYRRQPTFSEALGPERRAYQEALQKLRWTRARNVIGVGCVAALIAIAAIAWIAAGPALWWAALAAAIVVVVLAVWVGERIWTPIGEKAIKAEARKLYDPREPTGVSTP